MAAIEFITNRREKITNQFYDKILISFDNANEVNFAKEGAFSFPLFIIPEVHIDNLIHKLKEEGLHVYNFVEIEPFNIQKDDGTIETSNIRKPYYKVLLTPLDLDTNNEC